MMIAALDVGAKVRVLSGPFAGRRGVISELDGRGGALVTFGLLSARVLLENLGPGGELARPSMQSSHRRPQVGGGNDVHASASRSKKRAARRTPNK